MFKLNSIKANNGATLHKDGSLCEYKRGYQVSEQDLFIIPVYKLRKRDIIALLNTLEDGKCLGIWIDHKKAYIDISERVTNKRKAIILGKERCQKAIYDWKTGDCIPCW